LARSVPLSNPTARAIAGHARHLLLVEGAPAEAIEEAREALAFAVESDDDQLALHALNTVGLGRVDLGDAGGIEDLEQAVERAEEAGIVTAWTSALNNLANSLWIVGRLEDASARFHEMQAVCERYGRTGALTWLMGEWVYEREFHGDLDGVLKAAAHFLSLPRAAESYQTRPVLATRACAYLARGQIDEAVADAEQALASFREGGQDAQIAAHVLTTAARCLGAAGRRDEADALLTEALSASFDEVFFDLPLELVEVGRGEEFLAAAEGRRGFSWLEAGRAAAAGELVRASEVYGSMGARIPEARAALLAAEGGDTSRLDAALSYFEEQRATPFVQRCRALLQASA
jgi:tetratricopeptide (TPR) repeat protein